MGDDQFIDTMKDLLDEEIEPVSKRERTRLKILASAARVFSQKGFHKTSIQDIADDAGIAKGTIYYYIETKEDLLAAILDFAQARLFSRIDKRIGKAESASKKLELLLSLHVKTLKTAIPIFPFFAQDIFSANSRVKADLKIFRERYLKILSGIIREGIDDGEFRNVDADKAAVAILGMVLGQVMQAKVFDGGLNAKWLLATTIDMTMRGLAAEPGVRA